MIETLESISWWLGRYGATIGLVLLVVGVGGAAIAEEVIAHRRTAAEPVDIEGDTPQRRRNR